MKKITFVVESFGGGVYSYIKDVCQFLVNDDLKISIIYSPNRKDFKEANLTNDFSSKIEFIPISMASEIDFLHDFSSIKNIRKELKRINPDIIHLHSSKAGVLGRVAAFGLKKQLFYSPHGYSFLRKDVSPLKRKIFYQLEKITSLIFGGITVACGDSEYEYAKKIGQAKLVRNGINIDKINQNIQPKTTNSEHQKLQIGTLGRICYQKNPILFNSIAQNNPMIDFIWIGDGELRKYLTAPNITITGWKKREDVYAAVNDLDIYIQPSLWEGLPIALIEAMALSKPIIATYVEGNKDAVKNNYNGYLITTIEEASDAIKHLQNSKKRLQMGENSFVRCKELFNLPTNLLELKKIYFS